LYQLLNHKQSDTILYVNMIFLFYVFFPFFPRLVGLHKNFWGQLVGSVTIIDCRSYRWDAV